MSEERFTLNILYGVKELDTRIRATSGGFVGEGRSRVVSPDGVAGHWSEWEATGVRLVWDMGGERGDDNAVRPWWKFWGNT